MAWMYPEHQKREHAAEHKQKIEEFLEFIYKNNKFFFVTGINREVVDDNQIENALKAFFGFDDEALAKEKQEQEKHKLARQRRGG